MSSKFSTNVEGKIHEIRLDAKKGYQALFEVILIPFILLTILIKVMGE